MAWEGKRGLTRGEVCRVLGINPEVLNRLSVTYSQEVPGALERRLDAEAVQILRRIVHLERGGLSPLRVRQQLREEHLPGEALLGKLEQLTEALGRQETKQAEDRDRLLTALMRTQQELNHLRYEVGRHPSRRERKRGFFRRLVAG